MTTKFNPYKIGMVGAPASGKSTFAAMLYAELLKRGINSSRLVMEKAAEHLGQGGKIDTVADQIHVSHLQMLSQLHTEKSGFTPIICDGAIFMGEAYMNDKLEKFPNVDREETFCNLTTVNKYMEVMNEYKFMYDIIVYCPLPSEDNKTNKFRIHDGFESKKLATEMRKMLYSLPKTVGVFELSNSYSHRVEQLQELADHIQSKYMKGGKSNGKV